MALLVAAPLLFSQSLQRSAQPPPAAGANPASSVSTRNHDELQPGTPLWIQLDRTAPMRPHAPIIGHLTTDVYSVDQLLLPAGSRVYGHIDATEPVDKAARSSAVLNGDFTPLKQASIRFDSITLPDGRTVAIHATATQRDDSLIAMRPATTKRPSVFARIGSSIHVRAKETAQVFTAPRKGERFRRFLYGQLPWHPQSVWFGTQYLADLDEPSTVPAKPLPPAQTTGSPKQDVVAQILPASLTAAELRTLLPQVQLEARLDNDLSSRTAKAGDPVGATLTRPVFAPIDAAHAQQRLVFPEGTRLSGSVLQAKAARSWARNGTMRFTFRSIEAPEEPKVTVQAQVAAIDGANGQNLSVDSEGGTKANPDKNRILGPLTLALLAGRGADSDHLAAHGAVAGNSFGLLGRVAVIGIANQTVTLVAGGLAFGTSVYHHWIARGHDVVFLRDTRMVIAASQH